VIKLNTGEFSKALCEGRGAALMHVMEHGLEGIEDLVLAACLEEQAYDAQCEGHRALWLYRMFKDAPEYAFFRQRIIAELADISEESSAEQLCELACLMAQSGDDMAGAALREFVWRQDFSGGDDVFAVYGCHAIASLDGLPAVIEIARRYGRILMGDPQAFLDTLDELVDGEDAYAKVFAELTLLAKTDQSIAAYVAREQDELDRRLKSAQEDAEVKAARKEQTRAEIREQFALDEVLSAARRHDKARGKFMRIGRWGDKELLTQVLGKLNVEPDIETCLRLLWIFRDATLPYVPERLWTLADHEDARLRDAALTALAHSDDPAVGEFGRQYLGRGSFCSENAAAIELLTRHYKAGDENLIMGVLAGLHPDETEAHEIGMSIRAFCQSNNLASTADILEWLYRTNPCTICRGHAVELLSATNSLSPEVTLECRFDASATTRALVK
jgi:hypothetical protein